VIFLPQSSPDWLNNENQEVQAYKIVVRFNDQEKLFENGVAELDIDTDNINYLVLKSFKSGVSSPEVNSLISVYPHQDFDTVKIVEALFFKQQPKMTDEELKALWIEPAIEDFTSFKNWEQCKKAILKEQAVARIDDPSFRIPSTKEFKELTLTEAERKACLKYEKTRGRLLNFCEWEVIAQTWSEHCSHKIFSAHVKTQDTLKEKHNHLFKSYIKKATDNILDNFPDKAWSVFHDNSGVIPLYDEQAKATNLGIALKMETHNSPSAISPYGGASTGIVGVQRDILGTGLGAKPIAGWDVLCLEDDKHQELRPKNALNSKLLRSGVIQGIEDGSNQSGIPAVNGSVYFDSSYSVKPLVFAGCVGLIKKDFVKKQSQQGLTVFCIGGATGLDGIRGATMSSRDLRSSDFSGSSIQVAEAFVQRKLTDCLLEAQSKGWIQDLTDNGAGGLSCSLAEMARAVGGIEVDLTKLRLKYKNLLSWQKLLSESQERMTVATLYPDSFEKLCHKFEVGFDRLGSLKNTGHFVVRDQDRVLVDLDIKWLFEACPQLELESTWTLKDEKQALELLNSTQTKKADSWIQALSDILSHDNFCSREGIVRRFDHGVQGRTLNYPYQGKSQESSSESARIDLHEYQQKASIVLSHGLAPHKHIIEEQVLEAFDKALRKAICSGARLQTAGILDNFSWPDPDPSTNKSLGHRYLWKLVRALEILYQLSNQFKIPFVSGKDSMKNNSAEFYVKETVIVSLGASASSRNLKPVSFFSRSNDIIFYFKPLQNSFRDSAFSQCGFKQNNYSIKSAQEWENDIEVLVQQLKSRYSLIEDLISQGKIRAMKEVSSGGLWKSLFQMTLGNRMGFILEKDLSHNFEKYFEEGLGSFVLSIDPHFASEVEALFSPDIIRVGSVRSAWSVFEGNECSLEPLYQAYKNPKQQQRLWGCSP